MSTNRAWGCHGAIVLHAARQGRREVSGARASPSAARLLDEPGGERAHRRLHDDPVDPSVVHALVDTSVPA
jgi:hypothetical protein